MIKIRRAVAVAVLLAAVVAVMPAQPYETNEASPDFACPESEGGVIITCSIAYETDEVEFHPAPALPSLRVPRATRLATNGVPGCVRGEGRPIVGTTTPTLSAVFAVEGKEPTEVIFEQQRFGDTESTISTTSGMPGQPVVLEAGDWGLGPGESYRWRVRGTPWDAAVPGWSQWCEFTVEAGLVDLRDATDVDAVRELRVAPKRRYTVKLTERQWRLVLDALAPMDEGVAVVGGPGEMETEEDDRLRTISGTIRRGLPSRTVTLTGDQWATAAAQTAGMAQIYDQLREEEPDVYESDGSAYWKAVDRISAQLGGPAHPGLGADR
ncbi:hypothetical protein [Paractinoplanes atraurantiacus]|uniref:Uncharacterized protein n=1 Tax=Paractinoplanes atraurantiacus TaxID=1036182 RepID=A0A285I6P5_9ACTN|nr:hypothetical protein [Actinoplanes atraurantiacus]SNY42621.1 hypothetical protein SAMN05421748_106313 [Actinoplanes atraurantiacus]